jgi:hypothetical protein
MVWVRAIVNREKRSSLSHYLLSRSALAIPLKVMKRGWPLRTNRSADAGSTWSLPTRRY